MKRVSVVGAAVVLAAVGAIGVASLRGQTGGTLPSGAPALAGPLPRDFASYRELVRRTQPAVVSIDSKAAAKPAKGRERRRVPDELRKFFDELELPDSEPSPQAGFGSGFFIDPAGVILTNAHVVEGAESVVVTLHDGKKVTSRAIRADSKTDLAIVLLDASSGPYPALELGDSDAYEIGDRVLAFGAPFGLTGSVTQGIVSAKGRRDLNMNMYEDFIQTDAAINPGNSGGPLVGLDGKVLGINAAIKSRTGGFQGVGLAVASNLAKSIAKVLREDGVVRRAYLGVQVRELQPDVAQRFGLPREAAGVLVGEVFENTPADKAKLQPGDVVLSIAGQAIKDGRSLQMTVAGLPIGKPAPVEVFREGKRVTVPVTMEEQPRDFGRAETPAPRRRAPAGEMATLGELGMSVVDLTDAAAAELGYRKGVAGVAIAEVKPGSPAAEAGLRKGMLVLKIDAKRVATSAEATQAMESASLERGVLLMVQSPTGGTNFVLLRKSP